MHAKHRFTLIALLVVIAIIALLMGVLLPALGAARERARRSVCSQNEKNMGLGLFMYDDSNHIKKTNATGGNILFVDGHVTWRPFTEMELRWPWQSNGNPCFWW